MFMLSFFFFLLVCGRFEWKRICAGIYSLFTYLLPLEKRTNNTMAKKTNNNLQNIKQKTNERATRTPQHPVVIKRERLKFNHATSISGLDFQRQMSVFVSGE
jgi:hypothetical protein